MHSRSAQKRNVIVTHTALVQLRQKRRYKQMIRAGARNIRENYADPVAWMGNLAQGRGANRVGKRLGDCSPLVCYRRGRLRICQSRTHFGPQ